jgi:hypothetical protein
VQRLATIAHGDGICTTHVTPPALVHTRASTPARNAPVRHRTTLTNAGGISA